MKKALSLILALVMCLSLCACGEGESNTPSPTEPEFVKPDDYAMIMLVTINPQVRLYIDKDGQVLAVESANKDAKKVIEDLDFRNNSYETVISEFITAANASGYVNENARIVFKVVESKDQQLDAEEVLGKAADSAKDTIEDLKISAEVECEPYVDSSSQDQTEGTASEESHTHDYGDATCTAPKTCKTCGATEGAANGHSWQDATCTASKTCKTCGATDGTANGHSFADGKCTVCNEIDPTFKALETGCWSIERYVDDVWVTHSFFFSSGGSWGQPSWHYSFQEPASDATVQDAIANGIDVEKYKHENGKYYILGGGDSGPATCTMDGDAITMSVYNAVITLRRTAGNQLTVEKYDGSLFVGNWDIRVGDVLTWRECKHGFNDGKCSFCGASQPNYKVLDTGVWTAEQVVNGRLYKVTLNFKDAFCSISYGDNIHDSSFDANFRDQLLQAYENDKNALTVVDGIYYYCGSGDGGNITYTANGNLIQVNCDGYINMSITRTAGNQLTITQCDILGSPSGIVLTCSE